MPGAHTFDVDELAIFGKIQLFGRRTTKLSELFTTTRQFTCLRSSKIDGIEEVRVCGGGVVVVVGGVPRSPHADALLLT